MALVYLDTETTGLDPTRHEIWELAFAVDDQEITATTMFHSLRHADPTALSLNGYWDRVSGNADPEHWMRVEAQAKQALNGNTLVCANPAFDAAFLQARWGSAPWKYRLFDIEAYAMGALGYDVPHGLKGIAEDLRNDHGFDIPEPNHTAAGDVDTLRWCHRALRELYGRRA